MNWDVGVSRAIASSAGGGSKPCLREREEWWTVNKCNLAPKKGSAGAPVTCMRRLVIILNFSGLGEGLRRARS